MSPPDPTPGAALIEIHPFISIARTNQDQEVKIIIKVNTTKKEEDHPTKTITKITTQDSQQQTDIMKESRIKKHTQEDGQKLKLNNTIETQDDQILDLEEMIKQMERQKYPLI